ncbi:hypothetical protein RRG08_046106 [Elysia crispata]|uniref:Uncharacterized protein n=1 Tax=Elysia crispata TaxID=231223 RepID=A0AAE0Y5Y1_9GAST|nr:hypothetical protein RRG08_046106 [Elysia crispata]
MTREKPRGKDTKMSTAFGGKVYSDSSYETAVSHTVSYPILGGITFNATAEISNKKAVVSLEYRKCSQANPARINF